MTLPRVQRTLKPTVTTRIPRRHIIFDTEAHRHLVALGESQQWALGCYTLLDYSKRDPSPSGQIRTVTEPEELWSRVTRMCRKGERTVIWAHNLGYDLRISRAFTELPRLGWVLRNAMLERQAAWCIWGRGTVTLLMCDLFSWVNTSVEQLGRDLGIGKMALDPSNLEARCMRDVAITAAAVDVILRTLWGQELGSFRPTGAGMAYSAFCRQHMTHRIVSHDDEGVLALERKAMWAGRCEAWKWGTYDTAPTFEYDMESAYAYIGKECEVPTRYLAHLVHKDRATFERLTHHYRLLCNCTLRARVPCVPSDRAGSIVWPNGTFHTTLWDPEVRLAYESGCDVQLDDIYIYRSAPALRSFSEWVLDQMTLGVDGCHPVWGRVLKGWSRSLIGRLALRYRDWEPVGTVEQPSARISTLVDLTQGRRSYMMQVGCEVFELGDMHEGWASVPMITGYVMSEARVRLWKLMQIAGRSNVLYVDTDGFMCGSTGAQRITSAKCATPVYHVRLKQRYSRVVIRGPRDLDLDLSRRVAGIPRNARWHSQGTYDGEVWRGVRDSLQRGEVYSVSVMSRRFETKQRDTRRVHLANGDTKPHTMEDV